MTCKMYSIIDFPSVFEKIKSQPLSIKTSYRITLLALEIEKHIQFYQQNFHKILQEYGQRNEKGQFVPTEDGQGVKIIDGKFEECNNKLKELRDLDVELPDTKFNIDDFGDIALTPMEVYIIKPFIAE